jgi:hypothetical protein
MEHISWSVPLMLMYKYRKRQTKALLGSSKEVDLEVNIENSRHNTFMSHHQNAEQSPNMKNLINVGKCCELKLFWNDINISKLYSRTN